MVSIFLAKTNVTNALSPLRTNLVLLRFGQRLLWENYELWGVIKRQKSKTVGVKVKNRKLTCRNCMIHFFSHRIRLEPFCRVLLMDLKDWLDLPGFYKVAGSVDTKISTELFLEKWQNSRTIILHIIYPFQFSGRRWTLNSIVSQKVVTFSKARNSQWNNKKGHFLTTVPDENCAFDAVSCNI